jgi:hypothetical protein
VLLNTGRDLWPKPITAIYTVAIAVGDLNDDETGHSRATVGNSKVSVQLNNGNSRSAPPPI